MGKYELRPIGLAAYARHEMLMVIASFDAKAQTHQRQRTIEYLARQHGMDLATTKSLTYDPTFTRRDGVNTKGDIRIGPTAFRQDSCWLANVIFHEIVHSDQFYFYEQHGLNLGHHQADSEPMRVLVALDEFEGFYRSLQNSRVFALDARQIAELEREVQLWQIEIDDAETLSFIRNDQFDAARKALIKRLPKKKAATP